MPGGAASDYIRFMNSFVCPYCGQPKTGDSSGEFSGCKFCGFKSAMITGDRKLLIVDREMPYLKRRCEELALQMPDVRVVVDRRIVQDPHGKSERRDSQSGDRVKFSDAPGIFPMDLADSGD